MKKSTLSAFVAVIVAAGAVLSASGEVLGKHADNKIYAQTLVNEALAANPDILVIGLHAIVPGQKEYTMIASNLNSIGEKDGEDDVSVAENHLIILAPNQKTFDRIEVQMPLKTAAGKYIGSIVAVFKYDEDTDQPKLLTRALEVRKALERKVPSLAALLETSK